VRLPLDRCDVLPPEHVVPRHLPVVRPSILVTCTELHLIKIYVKDNSKQTDMDVQFITIIESELARTFMHFRVSDCSHKGQDVA
jgi:hypothetical protein